MRPDWTLEPAELAAIRAVDDVMTELGVAYMMVGATARDIMLTGVFGIEPGLATQDIDYAVAVNGWEEFNGVRAHLFASGLFEVVDNKTHKLTFISPAGFRIPVDLIPFGGVERPKNSVAWLSGDQGPMNVVGYDDAISAAPWVSLAVDLEVRVISIPSLAVLKIFAWSDRRDRNAGKDARDLAVILRSYLGTQTEDRLYGEALTVLDAVDHDRERLAPRLLGHDIAATCSPDTLSALRELMNNPREMDQLIVHVARAVRFPYADDRDDAAAQALGEFMAGLGRQAP